MSAKPQKRDPSASSFFLRDFLLLPDQSVKILIANVGVAPIYRDAYVAVGGVRGSYNLRELMPGSQTWVSIPCTATETSVPSIECDHLVSGQSIQYQADFD